MFLLRRTTTHSLRRSRTSAVCPASCPLATVAVATDIGGVALPLGFVGAPQLKSSNGSYVHAAATLAARAARVSPLPPSSSCIRCRPAEHSVPYMYCTWRPGRSSSATLGNEPLKALMASTAARSDRTRIGLVSTPEWQTGPKTTCENTDFILPK